MSERKVGRLLFLFFGSHACPIFFSEAQELSRGDEKMIAKGRRILALLNDPRHREKLILWMKRENAHDIGPIGGDQAMKVLGERQSLRLFPAGHFGSFPQE